MKKSAQVLTELKAGEDLEDSLQLKLLTDIRSVWPLGRPHMLTVQLLEALKALSESPWSNYGREGLNARNLAKMLRQFGPHPQSVRSVGENAKGYHYADFEQAFTRYLPSEGISSVTSVTTRINAGENENFATVTQ
jgi:hypothetical protein